MSAIRMVTKEDFIIYIITIIIIKGTILFPNMKFFFFLFQTSLKSEKEPDMVYPGRIN